MGREVDHTAFERADDERPRRGHFLHALLDHVIPVLVLHADGNAVFQLREQSSSVISIEDLNRALDDTASIRLHCQVHDMTEDRGGHFVHLLVVPDVEHLLDHIVPKHVFHERDRIGDDFVEEAVQHLR